MTAQQYVGSAAGTPEVHSLVRGRQSSVRTELPQENARARRIKEARAFMPLERLALSPQCEFASTMEGNMLTPADQEAKLRLVAETAREVWNGS